MAPPEHRNQTDGNGDDGFALLIEAYHGELLAAEASGECVTADEASDRRLDASSPEGLGAAQRVLRTLVRARGLVTPHALARDEPGGNISVWEALSRASGTELPLRQLGRFAIKRELGRGGFAVVFLAHDPVLNREVALKVPRPEVLLAEGVRLRFDREARAVARLTHPNLVPLFEVGEAGAISYIVSAYCPGPTLAQRLQECGRLEPREAARFVAQLAEAVQYAHSQGVLHRDIKPGNVLLEPALQADCQSATSGDSGSSHAYIPKLVDFGLAKLDGGDRGYSRTGVALGTPGYMAPEQAEGKWGAMGPATDVYGLGALLYEALTGGKPFEGANTAETLRRVLLDDPPRPRAAAPELPRDLEAICLKCLEKRPKQRYASAGELAADLRRYLAGEATQARPLGGMARLSRWTRRRPTAAALIVVSFAAVLSLVLFGAFHTRSLRHSLAREQELVDHLTQSQRRLQRMARPGFMRQVQHLLVKGDLAGAERLRRDFDPRTSDARDGFDSRYLDSLLARRPTICRGHVGETYGVAFSPDGEILYSTGADKTVRMWRTATAELLATLNGHAGEVNSVCVSPDGQWLFSVGDAGELRRWNARTGQSQGLAAQLEGRGWGLCISPNGGELWCVSNQGLPQPAYRWKLQVDGSLTDLETYEGRFDAVLPIGDGVALAGSAQLSESYVLENQQAGRPLRGLRDGPLCWSRSADGRIVAGGHRSGRISLLGPPDWDATTSWPAHLEPVESVSFWHHNAILASASRDGAVKLWDAVYGAHLDTLGSDAGRLWSVAVSDDDKWLAAAGDSGPMLWNLSDPTIRLWNQWSWEAPGSLFATALSPDGNDLALALPDGSIAVRTVWRGSEQLAFQPGIGPIRALWYSANRRRLALEVDRQIQLWNLEHETPALISGWQLDEPWDNNLTLRHLTFAGSAERCLLGPVEGRLLLVDARTGETLDDVPSPGNVVQLHSPPQGKRFFVRLESGRVLSLADDDLAEQSSLQTPHDQTLAGCSSMGELIATVEGQTLNLRELATARNVASLAFDSPVVQIAFAPDDSLMAITLADNSLRLIDLDTREEVLRLAGLSAYRCELAFSQDGRALIAARLEGNVVRVRAWRLPD
ncbi:MAG: WD40 repeat domain-containing serine/threonine protein kinase [Pirellulales bacterium]